MKMKFKINMLCRVNMSELSLFQQALKEYNETKKVTPKKIKKVSVKCEHIDVVDESGIITCMDCQEVLERQIMHEQEWRNYGSTDGKVVSDPSRVQQRKVDETSIHNDIKNLQIGDIVADKADEIYKDVTGGQIFRGNSRKAIIFACVFYAYRILEMPQDHNDLTNEMRITRRIGLKGIKHVNQHASKDSEIHLFSISPSTLVKNLMKKFSAHPSQIQEVINLYRKIENRSSKLNQARPQSVSSGILYYWICLKKIDIDIRQFAKTAGLSVLTINKIAKEIAEVLNTPDVL